MTSVITIAGPQIDGILGKGSVAIVTDEALVGLIPTNVNGVDNCISIKIHNSRGRWDVYPGMQERHQMALVHELEEEGANFVYITLPMHSRSLADGWNAAATVLEAAANAAREQAKKAASPTTGESD